MYKCGIFSAEFSKYFPATDNDDYDLDLYSPYGGVLDEIVAPPEPSSEPLWAFLSLSILVIGTSLNLDRVRIILFRFHSGLAVAVYKSELCKRAAKKTYSQNPESWSDDEASISVGSKCLSLMSRRFSARLVSFYLIISF